MMQQRMTLQRIRSALLAFVCYFITIRPSWPSYEFVRDRYNQYYLVFKEHGYSRKIPDLETLEILSGSSNLTDISIVSDEYFSKHPPAQHSIHSLKPCNETLAVVERSLILSPPTFWKSTMDLPNMFNPTIQYWLNRPLLAYREHMYDVPIQFEWFSFQRDKVVTFRSKRKSNNTYELHHSKNGLIKKYSFNQLMEDPRLIPRQDGRRLLVQYTCKASLFSPPQTCYVHMFVDPSTNQINFTDSIVLSNHSLPHIGQKNWIAMETADQELYFIQSVNPFQLFLHNETDLLTHTGKIYLVDSRPEIPLPWSADYGLPIRGGSPSLLLSNLSALMKTYSHGHRLHLPPRASHDYPDSLRIAFFHTVRHSRNKTPNVRTYFMGAMAFCPDFPFQLFAMSSHPILLRRYYHGSWANSPRIDHVMFPIGVFERPNSEVSREEEEDNDFQPENLRSDEWNETSPLHHTRQHSHFHRYLWVTFGYLDRHGSIAKFELKSLLESLEVIGNCSSSP